jgi:murein DD-endopeptidase MepM/ murein hydrolase activator NlpD
MRASPLPLLVAVSLAATAALAPAAQSPPTRPVARSSALLVEVLYPTGPSDIRGQVTSRRGRVARSAAAAVPADGSLVTVHAGQVSADSAPATGSATARANARIASASLMGGMVLATGIRVSASATADGTNASGVSSVTFTSLQIAGQTVRPRPDRSVQLPAGAGTVVVSESVDSLRMDGGHKGFAVALHLRLKKAFGAAPAGTEVLVGYAEAGAAAPPPAPPPPPAPAAPVAPAQPAIPNGSALGHDTTRSELPPPGGFTRTPPISAAARAQLLSGEYVFPVVGGARFSDDFGGPRADTGFHQGIDLFAPDGTPVVALHDGTLFLVGWNRLGGRRIWLDDGHGNLFYYAHLSGFAPLARDGAVVKAGDVIGFVGDSGDAQGTPFHLHLEIHPGGLWAVPPIEYVTAWLHATPGLTPTVTPATTTPTATGTVPSAITEAGSTDLGSASGLDDQSLATAAGGSAEAGIPQPLPDAVQEVSATTPPAFLGSR